MLENTNITIIAAVIIVCFLGIYLFVYKSEIRAQKKEEKKPDVDKSLQLQAYERLTILAERLSLKNLVSRISPAGMQADVYHSLLVESIKHEYDYNLSQQLYVSSQAWQAITNLKEQNIFIIHQLSNTLPPNSTGIDLVKRVLELLDADPKTSLHTIVLDTLRFDAKKILTGA
jgi:pantothenate kinase